MKQTAYRLVLDEFLLRLASSPHAAEFVLRGGLMTQLWVGPDRRATRDIDFLGHFPHDMEEAARRVADLLSLEPRSGVAFGLETLRSEVIWKETDFPGLRFLVEARLPARRCSTEKAVRRGEYGGGAEDHVPPRSDGETSGGIDPVLLLQIDIGFDDPLVPAAEWIDYPTQAGRSARIFAVRPELLVAWKLDGLFDHGAKRWQAKDLFDLYLLTSHCTLDLPSLAEGIRVAFEAHGDSLGDVLDVLYRRSWWETGHAEAKWEKFRASAGVPVPVELLPVATSVARALRPAMERLIDFPRDRSCLGDEAGPASASPPPPSSS